MAIDTLRCLIRILSDWLTVADTALNVTFMPAAESTRKYYTVGPSCDFVADWQEVIHDTINTDTFNGHSAVFANVHEPSIHTRTRRRDIRAQFVTLYVAPPRRRNHC